MKGLSITKEAADAHNARVEAEEALYAKLTPEERRHRMQAKALDKKRQLIMDAFKRLGPITEKPNDNPTRPEIPNAEQCERAPSLENRDEAKAPSAGSLFGGTGDSLARVRIILNRTRLLDVDAAYSSVKDVLDCTWRSSLVSGDRPDQITLLVEQHKVRSRAKETTEVIIEYL